MNEDEVYKMFTVRYPWSFVPDINITRAED